MNNHNYWHFVRFAVNRELNELYISVVLRSLAFSIIGIFVPLYLYKELGYSLAFVIYFFLIYSIVFALFSLPSAKLISNIGLKKVILISSPFYIVYFIFLYLLKNNPYLFVFVPVLLGIGDALFWLSFHIDFASFSDKKKRGREVGMFYNFSILAGLVGPLIGGLVLTFSSFKLLFFIVAVLCVGSVVPLFFSKDVVKKTKLSWNFFKHANLRDALAFISVGARGMVVGVFWPIFMFMILGGYLAIGSLVTIIGLISVVFNFLIGELCDIYKKRIFINVGAILHAISWFVRVYVKSKMQLIAVSLFSEISLIVVDLPFSALTYDKAARRNTGEYLVFRELSLCLGRILVLLLVLLSGSLLSSFWYAGFASLAHMLF